MVRVQSVFRLIQRPTPTCIRLMGRCWSFDGDWSWVSRTYPWVHVFFKVTFGVSGPDTGKRKRVTRKADGKLTRLMNFGRSWHEKLTLLVTHFNLPISGPLLWLPLRTAPSRSASRPRLSFFVSLSLYIYIHIFIFIYFLWGLKAARGPTLWDRS